MQVDILVPLRPLYPDNLVSIFYTAYTTYIATVSNYILLQTIRMNIPSIII